MREKIAVLAHAQAAENGAIPRFSLSSTDLAAGARLSEPERLVSMPQTIPKFAKNYPQLPVNIAIYMEWQKKLTALEGIGISQETASI